MQGVCEHSRTQVVARSHGVDYIHCLDCGQVFEGEDLDPAPEEESADSGGKSEDLR